MRLLALAACVVAVGCKRTPVDEPRYLAIRNGRLVQIAPDTGDAHEVASDIAGTVMTARVVAGGHRVIASVQAAESEIWRIEVEPFAAERVWHERGPAVVIDGVSDDGRVVALGSGRILDGDRVEDLKPPKAARWWSGDVSPDGRRIAISFAPTCASERIESCRFEVWGFDRDDAGRGWRRIAAGPTSAYNPRFVPGRDELAFHAAVRNPDKPDDPWGTRVEDTFTVGWSGGEPRVLSRRAWTPRFSPDGRWVALASTWDKELRVGEVGGELASIASDARFVGSWSADGAHLSYVLGDGRLVVIARSGDGRRTVGDGRDVGWIVAPLPQGKRAPAAPTSEDRADDEMSDIVRAFQRHARGDERLYNFTSAEPHLLEPAIRVASREELAQLLAREQRVLVVVPAMLACEMRELAVVDATPSYLLATNHLAGDEVDRSPLRKLFLDAPPEPAIRATARFDDAIDLVGADVPRRVRRGERFAMTLYYRVRRTPSSWKTLVHFDGSAVRFSADHDPICSPPHWRAGDVVADRFDVTTGPTPGPYKVWIGFYTGGPGTYRNAPVVGGERDAANRVAVTTVDVE